MLAHTVPGWTDFEKYGMPGLFIFCCITAIGVLWYYIIKKDNRIADLEEKLVKANDKLILMNEKLLIGLEKSAQVGRETVAVNEKMQLALRDEEKSQTELLIYFKARDDAQRGR